MEKPPEEAVVARPAAAAGAGNRDTRRANYAAGKRSETSDGRMLKTTADLEPPIRKFRTEPRKFHSRKDRASLLLNPKTRAGFNPRRNMPHLREVGAWNCRAGNAVRAVGNLLGGGWRTWQLLLRGMQQELEPVAPQEAL